MEERHILPVADQIDHEETEDCPCGPKVTFVVGGKVVTHNSLDGREREEPVDPGPSDAEGLHMPNKHQEGEGR